MKTFAERLQSAMKDAGYTQASLAQAVGVSVPSIWKLISGKSVTTRKLVEISNALGVEPEWLSTGKGPIVSVSKGTPSGAIPPQDEWIQVDSWDGNTPLNSDEVEVPFLRDIEFACGDGSCTDEDYNGFKLRFSKATLRRVGARTDGKGVLCFPARGDSMEPNIPDGTTVAVNTDDKRIIDGKIYAIAQDGWKRIKMLYRVGPHRVSIRSFNSAEHTPEECDLKELEIIGRVFWWSVVDY
ncbi:XRE family transcriptional regulator [Mixta mediterraneensis]|uniref:XRE family transcriptional regulator n=1 Tax=Mixta mediterraneensis TaxID=2758443 RepID=UPI00187684B1|nr:helix-turn-helix transcriptional regulator [Mixta mediterraneensis]MBE5251758.1 helix-turn-helix transcriptional regulator [Mixta mediterraneensis]